MVIIYYDDKPLGLEFSSAGSFLKVLELWDRGTLQGLGWHRGFNNDTDGLEKDTVSLTQLSTAIFSYITNTYAGDKLVKAYRERDSGYLVLSKKVGLDATIFDSANNIVRRVSLFPG